MKIEIRKYIKSDLDEIVDLSQKVLLKNAWNKQMFVDTLNNGKGDIYVALCNDLFAGFVSFYDASFEVCVLDIAVCEELQGKGIGKMLLNKVVDFAEEMKKEQVYLEVSKLNHKAIALYEKCGFELQGERKVYYADGTDALIYSYRII